MWGRRELKLSVLLLLPSVLWAAVAGSNGSLPYAEFFALNSFKQSIYDDPFHILTDWKYNDGNPCNWTGVSCSEAGDHVLTLKLSNSSLKGFLTPEIGFLTYLQELDLSHNQFLGIIPKQIGMLKNLSVLYLSSNSLSGPIPPEIGSLTQVSKINFNSNGLTGSLPPEIGNLMSLVELHLNRNKLHGSIPGSGSPSSSANNSMPSLSKSADGLCSLENLKVGDLSYNFFIGEIPPCLGYLPRSSFQGNCLHDKKSVIQRSAQQCGGFQSPSRGSASNSTNRHVKPQPEHQKPWQPEWLIILEIVTGIMFLIFLTTVVATVVKRYKTSSSMAIPWKRNTDKKKKSSMSTAIGSEMLRHVSKISRQELEVACEEFSNIIGSSADSVVYKGTMRADVEIAVISLCISEDQWTSHLEKYFQSEVANLSRLNHENTSRLLGYCMESDPLNRMVIFEYASNGTLYEHLHYNEGSQLSWGRRMKIATGIARGLRYLHNELQPPFILSELHSNTVYLTEDFSPKLVDFESWKGLFSRSDISTTCGMKQSVFHHIMNSLGRRRLDAQENTFTFGVLLLEIISGRPPYCKDRGSLVDWASEYLRKPELMCHMVDPELRYFNHDDLRTICNVVSLCIQPEPSKRPSMHTLADMLESGIDTSAAASLKESPLAWAELALSS